MLFQVTNIRLDFTGSEDEITLDEQIDIQDDITNTIWEADDEDDLVEEITSFCGWCVNSLDFVHVLK